MTQIATRIQALREAAGLSESRLADNSAIPRTTFKRRLVNPASFTLEEIERLADALDADPAWLWLGDAA
jgi:transcriptional regulator with XRE-family HTH domain